ncbi:hypothetical protein GW781_01580, partial [bacterium]|nr:hypothetical protein [bacterium]
PVDYAGFNFSVLSEYRARLVTHKAEARVFEAVAEQLKELGMIKLRGRQRTDSLAVLTRVRTLNRIELTVETLRLSVVALLAAEPEWTRAVSGATLAASQTCGEDLIGPAPAAHSPQSRLVDGITLNQFEMNLEQGTAQCLGNQQTIGQLSADGSWHFKFAAEVCARCPLRARCCSGQGGRSLTLGAHYAELEIAHLRQQTEDFKEEYRLHRGGVEGCLSVLVRGRECASTSAGWHVGWPKFARSSGIPTSDGQKQGKPPPNQPRTTVNQIFSRLKLGYKPEKRMKKVTLVGLSPPRHKFANSILGTTLWLVFSPAE